MKDFECILGDSEFLDGQLLWYLRPLCHTASIPKPCRTAPPYAVLCRHRLPLLPPPTPPLSDKAELTRFQVLSGIVRLAEESVSQAKLNSLKPSFER